MGTGGSCLPAPIAGAHEPRLPCTEGHRDAHRAEREESAMEKGELLKCPEVPSAQISQLSQREYGSKQMQVLPQT